MESSSILIASLTVSLIGVLLILYQKNSTSSKPSLTSQIRKQKKNKKSDLLEGELKPLTNDKQSSNDVASSTIASSSSTTSNTTTTIAASNWTAVNNQSSDVKYATEFVSTPTRKRNTMRATDILLKEDLAPQVETKPTFVCIRIISIIVLYFNTNTHLEGETEQTR
jgi:hypothetical protein